jgi:hypothetical protein
MGIGSWVVIIMLLSLSISFVYGILRISERVLNIQEKLKQTGEQKPIVPLLTTGILGLVGITMTFIYYAPSDILSPIMRLFLYVVGILLYISSFFAMFFVGRSYSRPGFPKKAMSTSGVIAGLLAALLPFLLLLTLGKFVASGGMTRDTLMFDTTKGSGSMAEFLLVIVLLVLPSISGIFGAGVFGKLSLQK